MILRTSTAVLLGALLGSTGHAAPAPDCGPTAPGQIVRAAYNPLAGAYCVSSFGSSDTYFVAGSNGHAPYPTSYDAAVDLLSGDDAVNLQFSVGGAPSTGTGWLSPYLDAGSLSPGFYATGSAWTVLTAVHYTNEVGTSSTSSTIALAAGGGSVVVTIGTSIDANGSVKQLYKITNNTSSVLTGLSFADYFNFHPNGSDPAATELGVTGYSQNRIYTNGDSTDPSFVASGSMHLIDAQGQTLIPTAHDLGCADVLMFAAECAGGTATILNVESGLYNNADGPLAAGDNAGALVYSLGSLDVGQSVQIGVVKEVPEPAAAWLMLCGLAWLTTSRAATRRSPGGH